MKFIWHNIFLFPLMKIKFIKLTGKRKDLIIWRNLYSKDQGHIFSYIPILAFDFHTCIIYTSAGISLSHEIRKRTMGGEQDFLRKGYQKILKSMRHEVEKNPSGQKNAYKQMWVLAPYWKEGWKRRKQDNAQISEKWETF